MLDYTILPAVMGGRAKEISGGAVKVNLQGRLGLLHVPAGIIDGAEALREGGRLEFYFSYFWITDSPLEYEPADLGREPTVMGGRIREVNDTALEAEFMGGQARAMVPRRWVFTDVPLEAARFCEFYFSRMWINEQGAVPAGAARD